MPVVAYLGPEGTYTHQAALAHFGMDASLLPCETITVIFEKLVSSPEITHGVLPLCNSSFGPVRETMGLLRKHPESLKELAQVQLAIRHSLMRHPTAAGPIQVIVSHEQALGQCQLYIKSNYPRCQILPMESTAAAAKYAAIHTEAAAICSDLAGRLNALVTVEQGIQDAGGTNQTTFGVFARNEQTSG